jgi:predicted small lipoprotein YifL
MKRLPFVAILALAACGRVAPLEPPAGQSLPVKPALAQKTPDADELLTAPPIAKPERIDELMKRSQPRRADRFDLPPPSGEAPPLPETEEPAEDETRISTPQ